MINCGRGGVIDEAALLEALESGHVGGAGLDVFAEEPPKTWRLVTHPRVVATPHIGAQTREAQERIAVQITEMVLAALDGSLQIAAVNLPFRPAGSRSEPFLRLAELLGSFASSLHRDRLSASADRPLGHRGRHGEADRGGRGQGRAGAVHGRDRQLRQRRAHRGRSRHRGGAHGPPAPRRLSAI